MVLHHTPGGAVTKAMLPSVFEHDGRCFYLRQCVVYLPIGKASTRCGMLCVRDAATEEHSRSGVVVSRVVCMPLN